MIKNRQYYRLQAKAKRELFLQKYVEIMIEKENSPTLLDMSKELSISRERCRQLMKYWQNQGEIVILKEMEDYYARNSYVLTPKGLAWFANKVLNNNKL